MSNSHTQIEIALGAIFVTISLVILLIVGFRENTMLNTIEEMQHAEAIEVGAKLFQANCSRCHGENGQGLIGPPLNDAHFFTDRITEMGWGGTLKDYIIATASTGRSISSQPDKWPGEGIPAMPTWSQDYGGPLRPDQIRDIAAFILNWEDTALGKAQVTYVELPGPASADPTVRGRAIFIKMGCAACHTIEGISTGAVGPELTHIATISATLKAGYTAEDYIRESILTPGAYIVEGFKDGIMPPDFSQKLSEDQLNDLLAFLLTRE